MFGAEKAQFNGWGPEVLRKDDRVHQGTWRDKLCDQKTTSEDQEIKLENKEEQLNQLKETSAKELQLSPRKS